MEKHQKAKAQGHPGSTMSHSPYPLAYPMTQSNAGYGMLYPNASFNQPYPISKVHGNAMYSPMPMSAGSYMPQASVGPSMPPAIAAGSTIQTPSAPGTIQEPAFEESYVENILRMNLGKQASVYMTFENNNEWNAKVFTGVLEAAGRDHIIISDPKTGLRYLLLMVNLDYITFPEELNYSLPFGR